MENIINYICREAIVVIPVLYILGMFFKASSIKDKYIPMLLLGCSVVICFGLFGVNIYAFIQAVLVVGVAIFCNQFVKQMKKIE